MNPSRIFKMLKNEPEKTDNSALLARRRLLKLGAYVPPAIIGMAVLGSMPGSASASGTHGTVGSCMPSACQPCVDENSGNKDGNNKNGGDKNGDGHHSGRDHQQCQIAKEKKKHEKHGNKHQSHKKSDNKKNKSQAPTIPGSNREKSAWPFF